MKQALLSTILALAGITAAQAQQAAPAPKTTPAAAMEQKPFQFTLFGGLSLPTGT